MTDTKDEAMPVEPVRTLTTSTPQADTAIWNLYKEQSKVFAASKLLPPWIENQYQAITIMMAGRELGFQPMYALRVLFMNDGKVGMMAAAMHGMILRHDGPKACQVVEQTPKRCVLRCYRPGWDEYKTVEYTIEMAQQAGLTGKKVWQNYPIDMLRNRAISRAARTHWNDVLAGVYDPEEIGAPVAVDAAGEVVIDVSTSSEPSPQTEAPSQDPEQPVEADFSSTPDSPQASTSDVDGESAQQTFSRGTPWRSALVKGLGSDKDLQETFKAYCRQKGYSGSLRHMTPEELEDAATHMGFGPDS